MITWIAAVLVAIATVMDLFFYKPWRSQRLHRAALAAMARGDYGVASLKAQWALQLDPYSVPTSVTMADIAEHERMPNAVAWRERVLQLTDESADSLIAYASCALSFGRRGSAKSALDRVPAADRQREDCLAVAGAIALDEGDNAKAVRFYESALRLNPDKPAYRLALGKGQAGSDDYVTREAGRRTLAGLATDPALGVVALRTLIASYEARNEFQTALGQTQALVALPAHQFADEMLRVRLMQIVGDADFEASLTAIQRKAEDNPTNAASLLEWMNRSSLASQALEWALKRSPKIGQMPGVRPAIAGSHLSVGNWPAVLTALQGGAWKGVEHVRHAYRARALREKGETSLARSEWNAALGAAARKIDALTWLAQMAADWKWPEELEQSLWSLLDQAPGNPWAIDLLSNFYFEKNNTMGLRRIAVHLVKADPTDENAQHDLAISSLLLGSDMERAKATAKELYEKHPDNATYASTHAFSLHCAKRTEEGLAVLESLPPERLEEPGIAAYYGILLAANHSPEKARHFLRLGRKSSLLAEEKVLMDEAEKTLDPPNP